MNKRYICFSTETDGLVKHTIVNDKYIHLFPNMLDFNGLDDDYNFLNVYINHGTKVPEHITKINGIDDALLAEKGHLPEEAAKAILKFLGSGDIVLVTHNIKFHTKVLESFFYRLGLKLPEYSYIDIQEDLTDTINIKFTDKEGNLTDKVKKPTLTEIRDFYNIDVDLNKVGSIRKIYNITKGVLNERKSVKPASF